MAIPIILKGQFAGHIELKLDNAFNYEGCTLTASFCGTVKKFTSLTAGSSILLSFSSEETALFPCGTSRLILALADAQGNVRALPWAKIKVTDSPTEYDMHDAAIAVVPANALSGVSVLPPRWTEADLHSKINEIIARLGGTVSALALVLASFLASFPALGASLILDTAPKGAIYNDEAIVTNATLDTSGLATEEALLAVETNLLAEIQAATPADYASVSNKAYNALQKGEAAYWHTTIGSGANQGDYWSIATGYLHLMANNTKPEQTTYLASGIEHIPGPGQEYKYSFPTNSGTFALESQIPTDYLTAESDPDFSAWRTGNTIAAGKGQTVNPNEDNIALGTRAKAEADDNIVIGTDAQVYWENASSILPNTTGNNIAIGYHATVKSQGLDNRGISSAIALGQASIVTNAQAVAIGPYAHSHGEGTVSLSADALDKVYLGDTNLRDHLTASIGELSPPPGNYSVVSNKAMTAVQTETDPTISSWAKASTKPTYTLNEVAPNSENWLGVQGNAGRTIKILAQGAGSSPAGGVQVTASTLNNNNTTTYAYSGVAVKRSGTNTDYLWSDTASNGIVRRSELDGLASETWVENKGYLTEHQDISGKADATQVATIINYLEGNDARVIITNYDSQVEMPALSFEQKVSTNEWQPIWDERTRWNTNAVALAAIHAELDALDDAKADRAWGAYDSSTGNDAPAGYTWISSPHIALSGGYSFKV